jgi:hypothetical protein
MRPAARSGYRAEAVVPAGQGRPFRTDSSKAGLRPLREIPKLVPRGITLIHPGANG